jgi:LPXTG-site transpeptidase (sortase) family protein
MTAPADDRPIVTVDASDAAEVTLPNTTIDSTERAAGVEPSYEPSAALAVTGVALCILAALLLSLVAELTVVGALRHSRDQQTAYAELRKELAEATVPTGQTDADGALLAPGSTVALMRIPKFGLQQVVAEGTTSSVLTSGPGHRRDTVLPGQPGASIIFGRQAAYGGPFGRLGELVKGDTIEFTTGQGTFVYVVTGLRQPGDPQAVTTDPQAGRLTLVTADGTPYLASSTLRVDAVLKGAPAELPTRVIGPSALAPAERPMAGDPSAWIPLVFWAQALLLVAIGVVWLRNRWGRWQTWVVGVPLLGFVGLGVAQQVALLLPNLM